MVSGVYVDADPDPATFAHTKNPPAAKKAISPGHAGHLAGYRTFYPSYLHPNGGADRPDRPAACLFYLPGSCRLLLSAVGHIGQAVVYAALS